VGLRLLANPTPNTINTHCHTIALPSLDRAAIHAALNGNSSQMIALITQWDTEARLLQSQNIPNIKRLSDSNFSKAHLLAQQPACSSHLQFLPQTYLSAAILFALTEPDQIVAIPAGMRSQTSLYPSAVMDCIALDTDRFNSEKLFEARPDIAFVAHYSLPATVEALKNQGIQICELNQINTIEGIIETVKQVGAAIGNPAKGELLALFMEAAFLAIDNHRILHWHGRQTPSTLYLNYYTHFSTPTSRSLSGQLMQRMGLNSSHCNPLLTESESALWSIPMDRETIAAIDPDVLIIVSPESNALHQEISTVAPFCNLKAVRQGSALFLDEVTQESPSQYVLLAYFDLSEAITRSLCDQPL
jgi:iron complex transport system substrate-binding protein